MQSLIIHKILFATVLCFLFLNINNFNHQIEHLFTFEKMALSTKKQIYDIEKKLIFPKNPLKLILKKIKVLQENADLVDNTSETYSLKFFRKF